MIAPRQDWRALRLMIQSYFRVRCYPLFMRRHTVEIQNSGLFFRANFDEKSLFWVSKIANFLNPHKFYKNTLFLCLKSSFAETTFRRWVQEFFPTGKNLPSPYSYSLVLARGASLSRGLICHFLFFFQKNEIWHMAELCFVLTIYTHKYAKNWFCSISSM